MTNSVEAEGTKRNLQARHIQMIAIGGTIGTGLFIGSGKVLEAIGPMGTLLAFLVAGLTVFGVVMSLGEMATMLPVTGSFNEYAARFHSPALGFASGWVYWFIWAVAFPIELQACGVFLKYWIQGVDEIWFYMVILVILLAINLFTVAGFGEVEYWLSMMKVMAIVIFIFVGLYVTTNQSIGFKYYGEGKGAFAGGNFWSIVGKLPNAIFAFGGTELVGITAGEAANPRKSVPQAIKGTFVRVSVFYILTILIMGMCIPSDYASGIAKDAAKVSSSPFVAVMGKANIAGADHFINFISFIAVFSAGNSALYASSRTMMALCKKGYGPKFLSGTSSNGVPVVQLFITAAFGLLTILTTVVGADVVFTWLMNLNGNLIGVTWLFISIAHIYFRKAYEAQGLDLADLPYRSPVGVAGDYFSLAILVFTLVFAGITDYIKGAPVVILTNSGLLANYIYLLPVLGLYVIGIFYKGGKIADPKEVDLKTGHVDNYEEKHSDENRSKFGRFVDIIA
ncbi:amino acid permease/ SLC12A domain-containing protein [Globomyces pollinis-pini]|nr:amino acid permease/ SLC12A domain-containing protein [Globomyces pollinis-pini]